MPLQIELISQPARLHAGSQVTFEVAIIAGEALEGASAVAHLVVTQGWAAGTGASALRDEQTQRLAVWIFDGRRIAARETSRHEITFGLPAELPPSHDLRPAFARAELAVSVSAAYGARDYRASFPVRIRTHAPRLFSRTPAIHRTRTTRPNEPRLEVSLASSRLVAGEVLVGSVVLSHADDRRPRTIALAFEPVWRLHRAGEPTREQPGEAHPFDVEIPAGAAGRAITFQVRVPAAPPTFRATTHELAWRLVTRPTGRSAAAFEVAMPLEILDEEAGETAVVLTTAPRLAADRIASVLVAFAYQHGWKVVPPSERGAIMRVDAASGVELGIACTARGADGMFLVVRCAYASLGVGLEVLPSSTLVRALGNSIDVGVPAWDREHQVYARSAQQVIAPLRAVVPSLRSSGVLGDLVRWTDDELVIERRVVAIDATDLLAATDALARIATKLQDARRLVMPPPELRVEVGAWREVVERWHGALSAGDLSADGHLDGAPLRFGLAFDGRGAPVSLDASVGPTPAVARDFELALARPAAEAARRGRDGVDAPWAEVVARWPADFTNLRVAGGVASASWRWPAGASPVELAASHLRLLVESLRALVGRLEPSGTPYR